MIHVFYFLHLFKQALYVLACSLFFALSLKAQCPDKQFLLKRLNSPVPKTVTSKDQLSEFLLTLDSMNRCPSGKDSIHAFLYKKIGAIYYFDGDYLNALKYYPEFIRIISSGANKHLVNQQYLVGGYYWLSKIYESLNMGIERRKALDSCAWFAEKFKSVNKASLGALYAGVEYYYDVGDYHRSVDYATRCETAAREYMKVSSGSEYEAAEEYAASSLLWKMNALLTLKEYKSAEDFLANKLEEYKRAGLEKHLGTINWLLAEVQLDNKKYDNALLFFKRALKADKEAGYDFGCKQTWNTMGSGLYRNYLNDADRALACYRNALKYVIRDNSLKQADVYETLNIFANIGDVFAQKGLYDSAFNYFQLAFDQVSPGINEEGILHSAPDEMINHKKVYYLLNLVINKGDTFKKKYEATRQVKELKSAIAVYKHADELLNRIRTQQSDLRSKLFWRSDSRRLYEHAIDACYLQNNTADAFYFFEKSRAVLLSDQLNEQQWMKESDIRRQTQLKKKILRLEKELSSDDLSADHFQETKTEIFTVKQELDRLGQSIKTGNPLYYQSFLDTGFITIKYVQQKLLKEHHGLLEIFSGDSAVYTLLATAANTYLVKINKKEFEIAAARYIAYLSGVDLMNRDFAGFVNTSSNLYKLIFEHLPLSGNRIIISPDGQYFPFESLITSKPNQPITWFLNDHAVSYTYSARFLMNDFKLGSASTAKNFMGIAPVTYPSAFSLAALPGSDRSLHKIAGYFENAVSQVSSHASRSNFMRQFSEYRIIQLYTHAADSSSNNEPVIYFADSALYLSDLINEYQPLTRLVVLSACETGAGKIYQGEGVFSFNRGFAALGIPAAISNLWSVDNGSTYLLTELFYKWLATGLPTDVALQKAKLEFLQKASKEKSMPCYWAGPILVGKTDTIELNKTYPWKWIVFFAGIGCVVFWVVRKWVISKNN